ncbi:winged helix-turn-helix transcriptional regulator [Streptomyces sp. NPDC051561]|uniref:winged helix-turn-helix transcriptional regulator n=1 Tax=Streptomyces sp. NPDC051561 TaxID=3365658 RepID=UPI003795D7DE
MTRRHQADETCGIAMAAGVVGDWWTLLVLREIARGYVRFDQLAQELGLSRKVLSERLAALTDNGVLAKRPYQERPVRHEYVLTERGRGLLPVLVSLQDWADRWLLGDGTLTGTAGGEGGESARMRQLVGTRVPAEPELVGTDGAPHSPLAPDARATVLFAYPATGIPGGPAGIPGAAGCTLENRLFRDSWPQFEAAGIAVRGVSTQLPHEQADFAQAEDLPFLLLSDEQLQLAAALRLPTFRSAQNLRLKRLILVVDAQRTVRHVLFPVTDIPAAVDEALALGRDL